jgi:Tol biopolymer transport system component/DNA-binding winged helix-turn-helix (wHTH) protein
LIEKRLYSFGEFTLDATAKVLLRRGAPVKLTLKAVETLLVLAENAGSVVTKDEIMKAVWPDRVVDEANLMQNIAVVRKVLGAPAGDAAHIETYPGRGYRLTGPATLSEHVPASAPEAHGSTAVGRGWRPGHLWLAVAGVGVAALFGAIWLAGGRSRPAASLPVLITPLTRLPGREHQPAVTGDGGRVAFVWSREGNQPGGIWVQETGGPPQPRPVTRGTGHYSSPVWAPDEKSLAYLRIEREATEVVIAPLEGGRERVVSRLAPGDYGFDLRRLDWSGDGRLLVVSHSDSAGDPAGLVLISLADGGQRRLTAPSNVVGGDLEPRFSPDGRTISFVRYISRAHQELFTISPAGGAAAQLTQDGKEISGQDWTPDGRELVFASSREGVFRLWRLRAGAGGKGAAPRATGVYGEFPIQLSLSRKSSTLVYSVLGQGRNIWRLDLKEKTWTQVAASSGLNASPQYSPDGRRICFRSDRSGEEQLWVSQADGSNPVQVTRGNLFPSVGRWSPDGGSLVFNNHKSGEIHLARVGEGGGWTVRSLGANGIHPVFSADGKWIYAGAAASIVRIPAGGGAPSEVAAVRGLSLGFAPEGGTLYFVRDPSASELWRVPAEGGEAARVLDGLVPACTSCWAAAAGGIYYLGSKPNSLDSQTLYYYDLRSGRREAVADYPEALSPVGSGPFSLSPDRRSLLVVRMAPSNADLMRVEPFE